MLTPPRSTTPCDELPGVPSDVMARLRARGIRSMSQAVRAVRLATGTQTRIARAIPRMGLDRVLDREAVHLFLMLQLAADLPLAALARRPRRPVAEC